LNAGTLTLTHSSIRNNVADAGGGIANAGTLTITHSIILSNVAPGPTGGGGGISNGGDLTIQHSTIANNGAGGGGGIGNGGVVEMTSSAVVNNGADVGGGILNGLGSTLTVTNSTLAQNGREGSIANEGTVVILNSTIADNESGIVNLVRASATALVWNTIVASNGPAPGSREDCSSNPFGGQAPPITSLGNNIFGNPTGCGTLRASDLTGDPGLDAFTDDGTPGNGHFPLLPTSQAIDAGNDAVCPRTDQLGQRRIGRCDIGAIRFLDNADLLQDDAAAATQATK